MSLVHAITGEDSRFRRWSLYIFARYLEMPLMYWGYHLLRGRYRRLGANRLVRAIGSWAVAAPFGYAGDTARPMPVPEVLRLIDELHPPSVDGALSMDGDQVQTGSIAVGPCRCRAAHKACDHPLETDIVIRTGVEAWTRAFPHEYRLIDKEEAKRIVSECSEQGMWPMVFVHCPVHAHRSTHRDRGLPTEGLRGASPATHDNEYVICNCCTCGCVPYMLNRDLGQRVYPLLRGAYVAETDLERCTGHGGCVEACPFDVRSVVDGKVRLVEACFGCGVCVGACPEQAIQMRPA